MDEWRTDGALKGRGVVEAIVNDDTPRAHGLLDSCSGRPSVRWLNRATTLAERPFNTGRSSLNSLCLPAFHSSNTLHHHLTCMIHGR